MVQKATDVLGTPEGVAVFVKWALATGLCHRVSGEGEEDGIQE